ncbi:O-glucosyltransferase rumi homolog isoform X2 [Photinus pyralis]|uniref:O-glucosyltransferase rumi homolog isoform X2 n=1 Tax=Photinus pyralis TaxID=7054 RepID=UPI0012675122|nr:O-glucosyltransferase rumi homolog isoform X2 [Photinus pyralis]
MIFYITFTSIILFSFYFSFINCANDQCSLTHNSNCDETYDNKYSREANDIFSIYLRKYEEANQAYYPSNATGCKFYVHVVDEDLKPFSDGITQQMIEGIKTRGTKYQIINGRLYRDKDCMFPSRCSGIEYFLRKLVSKLPDLECVINTRDWPQIYKGHGVFGPIFSFSKTKDYNDIMYPVWAFWEGGPAISLYPGGIGKWNDHRLLIATVANSTSWNDKLNVAFFRGSRTSSERDPLVLLSRENPELVDAQYTKNQAWKSDADTLHAPPAAEVSFNDHCKYKYLFNFRGVTASFRFKHILLCKSLVFHVGDEWLEFFYGSLKPWVHYIPVEANANKETMRLLIKFVQENDDIARSIAENGFNFIWNHLTIKDVICYWRNLLRKYAKLLKYKPKLDKNLIEII